MKGSKGAFHSMKGQAGRSALLKLSGGNSVLNNQNLKLSGSQQNRNQQDPWLRTMKLISLKIQSNQLNKSWDIILKI